MKNITPPLGAFLLLILISTHSFCQAPNWLWAKYSNGSSYEYTCGIAVNPSGSLFVGGRCAGTMTFGGLSVTAGGFGDNPFMERFDNTGTGIWLKEFTYSTSYDYTNGFWKDNQDNTYSDGMINSNTGVFINKYNNAGVLKMNVQTNSPAIGCYGVAVDNNTEDAIYITGAFGGGTTNFGSFPLTYPGNGNAASGGQGAYLAKLDSNGNYLWSRKIAGTGAGVGYDQGNAVTVDPLGDVYVCGGYGGTPTFDGGTATAPTATYSATANPIGNLFLAKYDPSGNLLWISTATNAGVIDGAYWDHGGLVADSCGNVYLTGNFQLTAQFGTQSVTSAGGNDIFIAKCLNNGQWEWVQRAGGTGDEYATAIALDRDNDVYVGSAFATGNMTFSGGSGGSLSSGDMFVAKFNNTTGDFLWAQGGSVAGGVGGITVDKQKYVYITGSYNGTPTIGSSGPASQAQGNNYIAKLDTVPPLKIQAHPEPNYCPGTVTQLIFNVTGTFNAGNTFTAQLSDSNGSFINPINIGSVNGTTSGTITITIPANTPAGNYLIRVISSNPAWGSFNNNCYSISNFPTFLPGTTNISNSFIAKISNDTTVCPGLPVTLAVSQNANYKYQWLPAAGLSCDTCYNPTATVSATTTFTVVVNSTTSACSSKDSVTITIVPPPDVSAGKDTSLCDGSTITLNPTGGGNYSWSPAAGLNCVNCPNPVANPSVTTTYYVNGTNQYCSSNDSVIVKVFPLPTLQLNDTTICYGVLATLNAVTNSSLIWSPAKDLSCTSCNSPEVTPYTNLAYNVTAVSGPCSISDSIKITVDRTIIDAFPDDVTIYIGQSVALKAKGATEYSWLPLTGLSSANIANPVASPTATTTYTVSGYDQFGCGAQNAIVVNVLDPCQIPVLPNAFSPNGDGQNDVFKVLNPFVEQVLDFKIYSRWGELVFESNQVNVGWDGKYNNLAEPEGAYVYMIKVLCTGQEVSYKGSVTLIR